MLGIEGDSSLLAPVDEQREWTGWTSPDLLFNFVSVWGILTKIQISIAFKEIKCYYPWQGMKRQKKPLWHMGIQEWVTLTKATVWSDWVRELAGIRF